MVALKDVATLVSGGTPSRTNADYFGEGLPWVAIGDLTDGVVTKTCESLTDAGLANSAAKMAPAGTVLLAMYGASIGKLGVAGMSLCTNQAIAAIQPKRGAVDNRYLFHFLLAQRQHLRARGRGGAQPNISLGDLKEWLVPLPLLNEQRRIAALLDQADALRAQRHKSIKYLDDLTQSVFVTMFGESNSLVPLGDVSHVQGGLQITSTRSQLPREVPYLRVANVYRGHLDLSEIKTLRATEAEIERTRLAHGDLLVVEGHGNPDEIGRVGLWRGEITGEVVHQNHLIRVRCSEKLRPQYASYYLNSATGRRYLLKSAKTTSGLNTISSAQVKMAPIAMPSIRDQDRFGHHLRHIESARISQQQQLARLNSAFASLQSRAFRGEL